MKTLLFMQLVKTQRQVVKVDDIEPALGEQSSDSPPVFRNRCNRSCWSSTAPSPTGSRATGWRRPTVPPGTTVTLSSGVQWPPSS